MNFREIIDQKTPERMRLWGASSHGYQFVIVHEPGDERWSKKERTEWVGYTVSYKKEFDFNSPPRLIPGKWRTRWEAERACRDFLMTSEEP